MPHHFYDNSAPKPYTTALNVLTQEAAGLKFVHDSNMSVIDLARGNALSKKAADACLFNDFIKLEHKSDLAPLSFGVYENDILIGMIAAMDLQVIEQLAGCTCVSTFLSVALPDGGSQAWLNRILNIMEFLLDNNVATDVPGQSLRIKRFRWLQGNDTAIMPQGGQDIFGMDMSSRRLKVVEGADGISYLERA